jgi:hypothetical protein
MSFAWKTGIIAMRIPVMLATYSGEVGHPRSEATLGCF